MEIIFLFRCSALLILYEIATSKGYGSDSYSGGSYGGAGRSIGGYGGGGYGGGRRTYGGGSDSSTKSDGKPGIDWSEDVLRGYPINGGLFPAVGYPYWPAAYGWGWPFIYGGYGGLHGFQGGQGY